MPPGVPAPREAGPGEVLVLGQAPGVTVQAHGVGGQPNPGQPGVVMGGNVNVNRVNTGPVQRVHPRTQMDSSAGPSRVSASHGGGTTNYPGTVPRGSVAGVRDYCRQQGANAGDPAQQGIWTWVDATLSQLLGE